MKKRILAMALAMTMVMGTAALAAGVEKTISVTPMGMSINGQTVTPTKSDGSPAEVFAYDGATYVPLRYLSELLGIQVEWDANDPNTAKLVNVPDGPAQAANEADVIVVGGGLSGLTTATFAAKNGASVIVIEKLGLLGGSGIFSSGALMTCNSNGVIEGDDSVESTMDFWTTTSAMRESSGYPDMDRVRTMLEKTGTTVNQLMDMGLKFPRIMPNTGTGSMVIAEGGGAGLISFLTSMVKDLGVTTYTDCKGEELIVENGKIVGVKATGKDGPVEFRGKSVVLATGGFSRGEELIKEWVPEGSIVYGGRGCVGNTGDGMIMAQKVGAQLYENPTLMMSSTQVDADYNRATGANSALTLGTSLAVNDAGERFFNEAHKSYSAFGIAMVDNGYDHCYVLMNATEANKESLEQGIELGEVVKADSVSELAQKLGMKESTLKNTFDKYAAACKNGEDPEFGKAEASLVALSEKELYAVKYYPTSIGTLGGVKTNYDCQVLKADGSVIDGLFAVGEMSNRVFYNYHYIGGASLGLYSTMGRIVGEQVAQRAGK